jgi:hypothetical protein
LRGEEKIVANTENQQQEIVLSASSSDKIGAILFAILSLVLGIVFLLLGKGQLPALIASCLFFVGSAFLMLLYRRLTHTPVLIINAEGIFSLRPMLSMTIKWEEIDAIYCSLLTRTTLALTVDLSPAGLVAFFARHGKQPPRQLDVTVPQPALSIPQSNLPLPIGQLIGQIREQFAPQVERYHINLDEEHILE